jgi:hypothetical protein
MPAVFLAAGSSLRTIHFLTFGSGRLLSKFKYICWPNSGYILHESVPLRGSMKNLQLLAMIAAALPSLAPASDGPEGGSKAYVPPVMRESGTPQSAIFTLPIPPKILDGPPPVLRHAPPEYPAEFVRDNIAYLQSRLGHWQQPDAAAAWGYAQAAGFGGRRRQTQRDHLRVLRSSPPLP